MTELTRGERLQITLCEVELRALDDGRFAKRMPRRASAVRALLRRGLAGKALIWGTMGKNPRASA